MDAQHGSHPGVEGAQRVREVQPERHERDGAESRSGGSKADDPGDSACAILATVEGKRDADAGRFVYKDGTYSLVMLTATIIKCCPGCTPTVPMVGSLCSA